MLQAIERRVEGLGKYLPGAERRRRLAQERAVLESSGGVRQLAAIVSAQRDKGDATAIILEEITHRDSIALSARWDMVGELYAARLPLSKGVKLNFGEKSWVDVSFSVPSWAVEWVRVDQVMDDDIMSYVRKDTRDDIRRKYLEFLQSLGKKADSLFIKDKIALAKTLAVPASDNRAEGGWPPKKVIYPHK